MSVRQRQSIKYCLGLIIAGLILGLLTQNILHEWDNINSFHWAENAMHVALALNCCLAVQALLISNWQKILTPYLIANHKQLLRSYFLPTLGKYLPGKILFFIARVEMLRALGLDRKKAGTLFLYETLLLMSSATLIGLAAIAQASLIEFNFGLYTLMVTIILCVGVLLFAYLNKHIPLIAKAHEQLRTIGHHCQTLIQQPLQATALFLRYLALWAVYGFGGYMLSLALIQADTLHALDVFLIASAFVASWLLGMLAVFAPGGLGVREGALVLLLLPYLTSAESSLLAIIMRLCWTFAEFSFIGLAYSFKTKDNIGSTS